MNAGRSRALVLRDVIEIADFKNITDYPNPNCGIFGFLANLTASVITFNCSYAALALKKQ